ncbi:cache domain-containing protein [Thiomicrorhabdus sediminis]|uniref:Cache domain-containing protein n=1 Tax=Thiomicrorhabdus sediminis TaxID=2580412 RepID=A0A4P9K596_9GAMM|nr:cache domain-containing protein [Thiomicrorhabdus sediminis]QCU90028.1 hypothetical protein FE785_04965 [Thiomicrorhabdus sediminis]
MSHTAQNDYKEFIDYLPEVKAYLDELDHQDLWWSTVGMVGKINNENIDPQLLVSIVETQKEFQGLREVMIDELIGRYLNQANSEISLKAQTTIDIVIRNLFERTADVGFLATDDDLVDFMAKEENSEDEQRFIHNRIVEYVKKYTVYNDVLLIKPNGDIKAKLDLNNPVSHSHDPIIQTALTTNDDYVEQYRPTDLFNQQKNSLMYAKKIIKPNVQGKDEVVGVLCLSFNFEEEMNGVYKTLDSSNLYELMILDDQGTILSSNHPDVNRVGSRMSNHIEQFDRPMRIGQQLHYGTKTNGYQGFYGLPWFGYVKINNQKAFDYGDNNQDLGVKIQPDSHLYLRDLEESIVKVSTLLLIVILNGKIMSLKRDVKAFLPILDSFQNISFDIQNIFTRFIHHIHQVLVDTIQKKAAFSAALAVEIMDRNLYERANDCRWWALNSTFRQLLTKKLSSGSLESTEVQKLTDILSYINSLYTVYTNIILYDKNGVILAVSNQAEGHLVGTNIPRGNDTTRCLGLKDTQHYVVSDFHKSSLYEDRYTYIYHAAVKSWDNMDTNVGGIALVFDSEPEFRAMLDDTEPKYINEALNETTFSILVDRAGMVIASSNDDIKIGQQLKLPPGILAAENGVSDTISYNWDDKPYIIGFKVSEGYREYKNGDGYDNDVIALMLTGV